MPNEVELSIRVSDEARRGLEEFAARVKEIDSEVASIEKRITAAEAKAAGLADQKV